MKFYSVQASTVYNNTINIAHLFIAEVIISKSGFPVFEQVRMRIYRHKVTVSRQTKVATNHSNLYHLSPYCFSFLVVPLSFKESSTILVIDIPKVSDCIMQPRDSARETSYPI